MKKILAILFFALFLCPAVFAENWNSTSALNRVNTIGNKLLKANGVGHNIQFKVSDKEDVNAYANANKEIYVYKGLLEYVDTDDELAAVISHEMGHIVNGHCAKQSVLDTGANVIAQVASIKYNPTAVAAGNTLAQSKLSRHDEYEADLTGVDLMAKAGYNPLGAVSLLSKISTKYIDLVSTHPSGEKRVLNAYNYVEYNYPNKLKAGYNTQSYKQALAMVQPKVEKRKKSKFLTAKFEREQKNLLKRKAKRIKKLSKTNTMWDGYYALLLGNSN